MQNNLCTSWCITALYVIAKDREQLNNLLSRMWFFKIILDLHNGTLFKEKEWERFLLTSMEKSPISIKFKKKGSTEKWIQYATCIFLKRE